MGLLAVYEDFLKTNNSRTLTGDVTLQYVTTLKTFNKHDKVINHLADQNQNIVKKKNEKIVSAVEGLTAVAVIVDTTLQFISNGGAYLPGMDSMILDKIATLPVTHFVHFDQDDKITQIRLNWDQADLLRQVDVIGSRSRNWPIFEGKEQLRMITTSTKTANEVNPAPALSPRGRNRGAAPDRGASPSKKYIRDPHASLDLTQRHEEDRQPTAPNAVAPRESHKPAPRDHSDLFAAGHEDYAPTVPGGSPKKSRKEDVTASKGGSRNTFQPSRLFGEDSPPPKERQIYKTNPARYNHFDIGDHDDHDAFQHHSSGSRAVDVPIRPKGAQGGHGTDSQWGFEDFSTPEKVGQKNRGQDAARFIYANTEEFRSASAATQQVQNRKTAESHFEFRDSGTPPTTYEERMAVPGARQQMQGRKNAESHFEFRDSGTPPTTYEERMAVPGARQQMQGRKDAESHFDFQDSGTPHIRPAVHKSRKDADKHFNMTDDQTPAPRRFIARNAAANQLYNDPVFGEDEGDQQPLRNVTNNNTRKDSKSQWDITDDPSANKSVKQGLGRKGMESHWDTGEDDLPQRPQRQTQAGARREADKSFWDF